MSLGSLGKEIINKCRRVNYQLRIHETIIITTGNRIYRIIYSFNNKE